MESTVTTSQEHEVLPANQEKLGERHEQIVPPGPKKSCLRLHLGAPASKNWESEFLLLKPSGLWHLVTVALATHCLCSPRSSTQHNTRVSQTQNNMELNTTQNRVSQTQYNTEPDTQDTDLFSSKGKFMYHGHKLKIKVSLLPSTTQRLLPRAFRWLLHGNQGVFVFFVGVFSPHFKN